MQQSPSEMRVIFQAWRPSRSKKRESRAGFEARGGESLFPSHLGTGQAKIHVHLSTFLRDEIVASSDKERLQWLQRLQWSSYYIIMADIFCSKRRRSYYREPKIYYWLYRQIRHHPRSHVSLRMTTFSRNRHYLSSRKGR